VAQQHVSLLNWLKGKNPIDNAVMLVAGLAVVVVLSPVIVVYMLFVRFGVPATNNGQ
jgi:hypothetical protein